MFDLHHSSWDTATWLGTSDELAPPLTMWLSRGSWSSCLTLPKIFGDCNSILHFLQAAPEVAVNYLVTLSATSHCVEPVVQLALDQDCWPHLFIMFFSRFLHISYSPRTLHAAIATHWVKWLLGIVQLRFVFLISLNLPVINLLHWFCCTVPESTFWILSKEHIEEFSQASGNAQNLEGHHCGNLLTRIHFSLFRGSFPSW